MFQCFSIKQQEDEMRYIKALFILGFMAIVGSGCATHKHFSKLPTPAEFSKPLLQLKQEYPDLTEYESSRFFITIFDMPEAGPLKDAWSQPHSTGFTAWMLCPVLWIYHPSNYWYWEFEGKKISALIDRPMLFGYKPHVWKLKVQNHEKRKEDGHVQ
jgi:hypothetical protein